MDTDEAPVSPETSHYDQSELVQGPVTPWIPNATELENERQVKSNTYNETPYFLFVISIVLDITIKILTMITLLKAVFVISTKYE